MMWALFVFKQKTAYEMRIRDWSSDVCSSDLIVGGGNVGLHLAQKIRRTTPSVNIKIIEHNLERARYISDELGSGAIVLHGDALDQEMLEERSEERRVW